MILIGYSGHSFVVYGILKSAGHTITGYCDTEEKQYNPFGLTYQGSELSDKGSMALQQSGFFIAVGDNKVRRRIFDELAAKALFPSNAIHPSAVTDPSVTMSTKGVMLAAHVTINPLAIIGDGVICNTGCIIEHECVVGNFAHIGPGAVLCGNVKVGDNSFIGANAVVKQGVSIGKNVMVGAGAVVIKDVPDNITVVGVPAK
jgi:sugar O-acyltransferase (sialic acid O-acetyltransferase NeuD family)